MHRNAAKTYLPFPPLGASKLALGPFTLKGPKPEPAKPTTIGEKGNIWKQKHRIKQTIVAAVYLPSQMLWTKPRLE